MCVSSGSTNEAEPEEIACMKVKGHLGVVTKNPKDCE